MSGTKKGKETKNGRDKYHLNIIYIFFEFGIIVYLFEQCYSSLYLVSSLSSRINEA